MVPIRRRGVRFKARDLERGRKYLWPDEFIPVLLKRLEIVPGQTVVDVGSGTGFLTRLIAKGLNGDGSAIGFDRNRRLTEVAKRLAKEDGVDGVTSFRLGDAGALPLADGVADRVVCQTLLWTSRDPGSVLREMIRVCKPGGIVGAMEGAFDYVIWYSPDDRHLTELQQKRVVAYARGHAELYGSDRGIGYKLPALFHRFGLRRIRMDPFPHVWLEADDRVPIKFKLQDHRDTVRLFEHPVKKEHQESTRILKLGGMTANEIREVRRLTCQHSKRILRDPSLLEKDFTMDGGLFLLTTGVKG